MLTVCPKCTLTLAVTAADLRVGQGYVRCGRCATVFNALLALTDASTLELPGTAAPLRPGMPAQDATPTSSSATATVTVLRDPPAPPAPEPPAPSAEAQADTHVYDYQPFSGAHLAAVEDEDEDEITIDPSLAAEPLDLVLEQTSAVGRGKADSAPEFVLPPPGEPDDEIIDIDLGADGVEEVELSSAIGDDEPSPRAGDEAAADDAGDATDSSLPPNADDAPRDAAGAAPSTDATGTVQTIVMEGSSISQHEEFVDIDTIDSEIAAATRRALEVEARRNIAGDDDARSTTGSYRAPDSFDATGTFRTVDHGDSIRLRLRGAAGDGDGAERATTADAGASGEAIENRLLESSSVYVHDRNALLQPRTPPPKPPPSALVWSTWSALLLLLLGVQALHYWRNDLALRNDWIGQGVTRIYAALGMTLTPNWDLRSYDVRQLGAATNGSGDNAIRVRIRLTNRAARPQPYPMLRLSLYDRYGKMVAARDLLPRDYLPKDQANGMMPVSQQLDSEVAVMDPGPNASSFELDVCMPAGKGLRCASDSPLRPSTHP